jgi:protein TonB
MSTKFVNHIAGRKILMLISVTFMLAFISSVVYGQSNNPTKTEVAPPPPPPPPPAQDKGNGSHEGAFQQVDVMPSYPGGEVELMKNIADSIRYPKDAKENRITGKVIVRFMVKSDGSVSEVSVLKGVSRSLDNEAIRVVKTLKKFTPGKLNGEYVPVWYMLPVNYAIN